MKLFAALAVLVAATIGSASATPIQYSTTGSVFQSTGTNVLTAGTVTITFNSIASTLVNAPTGISYGFVDVNYVSGPNQAVPAFQLNLVVNNITDGVSGMFLVTSAGGSVGQGQDTIVVSFSPIPLVLGTASFTANSPLNFTASNTLAGQTSFQGGVNLSNAPEPGTMFLLGAGLIGIGISARKKFAKRG